MQSEADLGLAPTEEELAVVDTGPEIETPPADEPQTDQPAAAATDGQPSADKPQDEAPGTVDLRALQEARGENRELRQQNAVIMQRLNEVLGVIGKSEQPAEPQKTAEPPSDDPLAMLKFVAEKLTKQEQAQTEVQQRSREAEQHQQFVSRVGTVEAEFRTTTPDYDNAVKFVAESRDRELQTLFPYSTPEQRQQTIALEWKNIADNSFANGQNPAALIYGLAKMRGYAPAASAQAVPPPKPVDAAAIAAAQQRHQSLSAASGGEAATPIDAKALANMSEKQFREWISKKGNDKRMDEIMGAEA